MNRIYGPFSDSTSPTSQAALMQQYLQGLLPNYQIDTNTGQLSPVASFGLTGVAAVAGVAVVLWLLARKPRTYR